MGVGKGVNEDSPVEVSTKITIYSCTQSMIENLKFCFIDPPFDAMRKEKIKVTEEILSLNTNFILEKG